jgi:hypothetical protein
MDNPKKVLNMRVTVSILDEMTGTTISADAGTNGLVDADQDVPIAQRLAEEAVRQILRRR